MQSQPGPCGPQSKLSRLSESSFIHPAQAASRAPCGRDFSPGKKRPLGASLARLQKGRQRAALTAPNSAVEGDQAQRWNLLPRSPQAPRRGAGHESPSYQSLWTLGRTSLCPGPGIHADLVRLCLTSAVRCTFTEGSARKRLFMNSELLMLSTAQSS